MNRGFTISDDKRLLLLSFGFRKFPKGDDVVGLNDAILSCFLESLFAKAAKPPLVPIDGILAPDPNIGTDEPEPNIGVVVLAVGCNFSTFCPNFDGVPKTGLAVDVPIDDNAPNVGLADVTDDDPPIVDDEPKVGTFVTAAPNFDSLPKALPKVDFESNGGSLDFGVLVSSFLILLADPKAVGLAKENPKDEGC